MPDWITRDEYKKKGLGWLTAPETAKRYRGIRAASEGSEVAFHLEKIVRGERYSLRLGTLSQPDLDAELRLFARDPAGYRDAQRATRTPLPSPTDDGVYVTPDLIEAFASQMRTDGLSEKYIQNTLHYVEDWTLGPAKHPQLGLAGKDLRKVTLQDLHNALDKWKTAKQKRIAGLKAFTAFLRGRGTLRSADDASIDLRSIQTKPPSPRERAAKTYSVEQLEGVYRHLHLQHYRDAFRVRVCTGMHVTEIDRMASGDCELVRLEDAGEIEGTVTFVHKSGGSHTLSLDAHTYAACVRLRKLGTFGDLRNEDLAEAAKKAGVRPVMLANLRHTFVTLAATRGRLVQPPAGGVPLDIVAQIVGHHAITTTRRFYLGSYTPPMIALPLKLVHPEDPPLKNPKRPTRVRTS